MAVFTFAVTFPYEPFFVLTHLPLEFRHSIFALGHACSAAIFIFALGTAIIYNLGIFLLFAVVIYGVLNELE